MQTLQRAGYRAYDALVSLVQWAVVGFSFPAASVLILAVCAINQAAASLKEWSSVMPLTFMHMVVAPWVLNIEGKAWLAAGLLTLPVYAATEWTVQAAHGSTAGILWGQLLNMTIHSLGLMVTSLHPSDLVDCLVPTSAHQTPLNDNAVPEAESVYIQRQSKSHPGASDCSTCPISKHLMWVVDTLQLQSCAQAQLLRCCRLVASYAASYNPAWTQQLGKAIAVPSSRRALKKWASILLLIWQALYMVPALVHTGTCESTSGLVVTLLATFCLGQSTCLTEEVVFQPLIKLRQQSMTAQMDSDTHWWDLHTSSAGCGDAGSRRGELESLRVNSVALVHELVIAHEQAHVLDLQIKDLKMQQQILSETNSQLEAERVVLLNQREELVVENLTLAAENHELGAVLDVLEAGEQVVNPVSPADTILDITAKLINGEVPTREQVLLVKSAVSRNDDIYQPFNLGNTLQEMKMDRDVEQALMLQLGQRFPGVSFENEQEDVTAHAGVASASKGKRKPVLRQRSTVLGFPDLRTALAAIAADTNLDELMLSSEVTVLGTAHSPNGISSPVQPDSQKCAGSGEDDCVVSFSGIIDSSDLTAVKERLTWQLSATVLSPAKLSRRMIQRAVSVISPHSRPPAPASDSEKVTACIPSLGQGGSQQNKKLGLSTPTRSVCLPPPSPAPSRPVTSRASCTTASCRLPLPQHQSVPTVMEGPLVPHNGLAARGLAAVPSWPAPPNAQAHSSLSSPPNPFLKSLAASNGTSEIETVTSNDNTIVGLDDTAPYSWADSEAAGQETSITRNTLHSFLDHDHLSSVMDMTSRVLSSRPSAVARTFPTVNDKGTNLSSTRDALEPREARNSYFERGRASTALEQGMARAQPGMMLLDQTEQCLNRSDQDFQFDSFELASVTGGRPLSSLAYFLIQRGGLITQFKLNAVKLVHFLQQVESGYKLNPYHNSTHAADVLQTFHVTLHWSGMVPHYVDPLTLLACYLSAIVHDFEHGGLTNDYLIQTSDALAIRYNDRAPLENHHLAAAFNALKMPQNNFLSGLCKQDYEKTRKTIIELVLATDMKQHFSMLGHYKRELVERGSKLPVTRESGDGRVDRSSAQLPTDTDRGSWDCRHLLQTDHSVTEPLHPSQESERMLSIQMALKCADLGHIAEARDVHLKWVAALEEEFFRQGDAERAAGLPISPLFDRKKPGVVKSQVGFLEIVALPLFKLFVSSFPGAKPLLAGLVDNYKWWRSAQDDKLR